MSGIALTIGFDDQALTGHLARLAAADAKGFAKTLDGIGMYLVSEIKGCIDDQKLFDGRPMPQSASAIERAGQTLRAEGELRRDYTHNVLANGVEIGSMLEYAAIHHFGGQTGSKKGRFQMPARPVMGMTPAHDARIGDFFVDQIRRLV